MKKKLVAILMVLALLFVSCQGANQNNQSSVADEQTNETNTKEIKDNKDTEVSEEKSAKQRPFNIGVMFSPEDSLDPAKVVSPGGMILSFCLYDSLATMHAEGTKLRMADSIEASDDVMEYKIVLKEKARYSDGTEVSGQDVIDSLKYFAQVPNYQSMYSVIDFEKSSAEGMTCTLVLKEPQSDFIDASIAMYSPVAKGGNFNGIGAGGYVVKEGDAQTGFKLIANEYYYGGTPSIEEINLLNVPDSASKVNALKTEEIDYAWGLDASAIQTLSQVEDIEMPDGSLEGASCLELVLNTRVAPFNDIEARRAAKLTVDREKMVKTLLGDYGEIGNDMLGKGFETYPNDIKQTMMDKEEAKRIFEEKGITEFTIVTSDIMPGLNNATKMMVEDFKDVGVNVIVEELDPQSFFSQLGETYQKSAFVFYWMNRTPLTEFRSQALPESPYNVSGYSSDIITESYKKAVSTRDKNIQGEAIRAISEDIHNNGGEIIWGYQKDISAKRKGFECETTQSVPYLATATFKPQKQ